MSNHNKETEARCPHCYRHYVEGTAAWALYMMRMGRKVTNPKYDPRVYHLPEGGMIHINGVETIAASEWIDYWCIDIPDGWQLYEEPKPEPEPPREPEYVICKRCGGSQSAPNPAVSNTAYTTCSKCGGTGYEIKEQKPDDLYLNIKPSNPADWCFDKKNLLVLVDDNFEGIVGENVTREQVGEIAKLLEEK